MDRESKGLFATCFGFGVDEESASKLREAQNKVSETLSKDGFCYCRVGMSQKAGQSKQYSCRRMFQSGALGR
jgi:hypothetical protein